MKLLGDGNWYCPDRLQWLPEVSLESVGPRPAAEDAAAPAAEEAPAPVAAGVPSGNGPASAMSLRMDVDRRGARTRVGLAGELDVASAKALHQQLEELQAEHPELLVLDLRRLDFMDSSGLREIVTAVRRARADGSKVALVKAHGPIESVLELTRVGEMAETVDDPGAVGFPDEN
jgi:anti-anti-sigma factor